MTELPPAFSIDERAALPLLAREDENPIFDAFRRRRRVHSRRFRLPMPNLGSTTYTARVARAVIGAVGALFIFGFTFAYGVLLIGALLAAILAGIVAALATTLTAIVFMMAGRLALRLKATRRRIPRWCSDVFSASGTQNDLVLDLWMTGAGGGRIMEAMFLDSMEGFRRHWRSEWISMILLGVVIIVVLHQMELRVSALVFAASLAGMAWMARDVPWWGKANMVRARIRMLVTDWDIAAGGNSAGRTAGRGILLGLGYTALTFFGLILFVATLIGVGFTMNFLERAPWWPLQPWEFFPIAGSMAVVCFGIASRLLMPAMLRREQRLLLHEFTRADAAFDAYVRTILIKDDGLTTSPEPLTSNEDTPPKENRAP